MNSPLDPFMDPEHYLYYLFVEKNNYSHISIVILRKDVSIEKKYGIKLLAMM